MSGISNKVGVRLDINRELFNALKPENVQKKVKQVLVAAAKHIVGKNVGETAMASPIGRHFTKSNKDRYNFAPLTPAYAKVKKRKVGNKPILVFSGTWKKSAISGTVKATDKGAIVSANNPPGYAQYLEEGTGKMSARPAYTLNQEDRDDLDKFIRQVVDDLFGHGAAGSVVGANVPSPTPALSASVT